MNTISHSRICFKYFIKTTQSKLSQWPRFQLIKFQFISVYCDLVCSLLPYKWNIDLDLSGRLNIYQTSHHMRTHLTYQSIIQRIYKTLIRKTEKLLCMLDGCRPHQRTQTICKLKENNFITMTCWCCTLKTWMHIKILIIHSIMVGGRKEGQKKKREKKETN